MSNQEDVLDNFDLESDLEVNEESVNESPGTPIMGDEGWTDHVLGMLRTNECVKKDGRIYPKADGLVRLLYSIYGHENVTFERPEVHASEPIFASVTVLIAIRGQGTNIGSAECSYENTKRPFCTFPLATAETRAIGRAAKRALRLVSVLTAEEIGNLPTNSDDGESGMITDNQIQFIDRQCKKHNISVQEVVHSCYKEIENIKSLSRNEAIQVNKKLNECSDSTVRDQFGKYDQSWKNSFLD